MAAGPRPYRGLVRARRVLRGRRLNCQRRGRRWSRAAHAGCVLGCLPVLLLLPALLVLEQPEVRDAPRRRWWDGSWELAVVLRRRHFLHKTKAAISKTRKARAQKASTHESTHKRRTKARQKAQKAEKHESTRAREHESTRAKKHERAEGERDTLRSNHGRAAALPRITSLPACTHARTHTHAHACTHAHMYRHIWTCGTGQ